MSSRPLIAAVTAGIMAAGAGGVIAAGGGASSGESAAKSQYRPGRGCGDRNHPHTGSQNCKPHHGANHKPKPHHHKPKPHHYPHVHGNTYQNNLPGNPRHGHPFVLVHSHGHTYHVYFINGHTQIFRVSKVNTKVGEIEIRVSALPQG